MTSSVYQRPLEKINFNSSNVTSSLIVCAMFAAPNIALAANENQESLAENVYRTKDHSSSTNEYFPIESIYYIPLLQSLKEIQALPNNWNDNNASQFSSQLINKAKVFISNSIAIAQHLSVFPTANNSIQVEWELFNGFYCEAEIFENSIEIYAEKNDEEFIQESFTDIEESSRRFIGIYNS